MFHLFTAISKLGLAQKWVVLATMSEHDGVINANLIDPI